MLVVIIIVIARQVSHIMLDLIKILINLKLLLL